nr:SHOCT domain-containing protein [Wenjunlia tyrosinilytica]
MTLLAHEGWNGPGPWILFVPLVWAVVVLGLITFLRRTARRGGAGPRRRGPGPWHLGAGPAEPSPVDVLGRRFAEGQIDENEYWMRLSVLNEAMHSERQAEPKGGAR